MCLFPTKQGFPCGKCFECLCRQRNDWSIRLQFHLLDTDMDCQNYFATLTYDREHVPWVWCHKVGKQYFYVKSLCKFDVQKFLKLFRVHCERDLHKKNVRVKYFCAGEYGPKTHRPHYHIILFNVPCKDKKKVEDLLQKCWSFGEVRRVRKLIPAQCHYATKYMISKNIIPNSFSVKPFRMMSNGLGSNLTVLNHDNLKMFYNGLDPQVAFCHASDVCDFLDNNDFYFCDNPDEIRDFNPFFPWSDYDFVVEACRDKIVLNGHNFEIPRFVRERVYPDEIRVVLNLQKQIKKSKREYKYYVKYAAYDDEMRWLGLLTMKQQLNKQKYERLRKLLDKRYKEDLDKNKNII